MAQASIAANLVLASVVRTWDDVGRTRAERSLADGSWLDRTAAVLLLVSAIPPLVLSGLVAHAGWTLVDDGPVGWFGLALVALAALLAAGAAATAGARTILVARRLVAGEQAGRWWAAAHAAGSLLLASYVWNLAPAVVCWWLTAAGAVTLLLLAPALIGQIRAAGEQSDAYSSVA